MAAIKALGGARAHRPAIHAPINYLGPMTERPWSDVIDRSRTNIVAERREVEIRNAWSDLEEPMLNREGFTVVSAPSKVQDYRDIAEVRRVYPREMEALITRMTGARRAIAKQTPVIRFSSDSNTLQPAHLVHSDFTFPSLKVQLGEQGIDLDDPEFRQYSVLRVYQTWRALSGPGQDKPLAFADQRSVSPGDVVTGGYNEYQSKLDPSATAIARDDDANPGNYEFCLCKASAAHRWYYFPRLELDELIVWKGFDQADPASFAMHTAFTDPTEAAAPPRDSIEARIYAFF